jgi:hypothetical protein
VLGGFLGVYTHPKNPHVYLFSLNLHRKNKNSLLRAASPAFGLSSYAMMWFNTRTNISMCIEEIYS